MTDAIAGRDAAAAPSPEAAAAASSRASRRLLDAALSRAITAFAHDVRNALGVVSMQVEAIAARAGGVACDLRAVAGHAAVAAEHIERLAAMTNALIGFARGRATSDLAGIVTEAAALVPLRAVRVEGATVASMPVDALLMRAVVLEALILAIDGVATPAFVLHADATGATLEVVTAATVALDDTVEWVVQFQNAGGRVEPTSQGLRLHVPPIA